MVKVLFLCPEIRFAHIVYRCPILDMDKYKPRWNKALLEDVVKIGDDVYRKPIEWSPK
jgi:hypothetical protein